MATITRMKIPISPDNPYGLGRHVHHDSRSRNYPAELAPRPVDVFHRGLGLPLNQGQLGKCTAEALCGRLNTPPGQPEATFKIYTDSDSDVLYGRETADEGQPWPPNDPGGSGLAVCQAARELGWITSFGHTFSLNDALRGLVKRPFIAGTNWYECLPDDQRVLMADLRWVPIQKIQVGDELIGFDECIGQKARYRRARVTDLGIAHRPVIEIATTSGTVASSTGHLFVRCHTKAAQEWVFAQDVRPGDRLAYMMAPYAEDTSWEAGWLAGFFDGEGTINRSGGAQLNFGQALGPTLDFAKRLLGAKGYDFTIKQRRPTGTDNRGVISRQVLENVYLAGGYGGALRLLGEMRPQRLLPLAHRFWEGRSIRSRSCPPVEVQEVRLLDVQPVHTIGTTAKTLVVEGFLSHNSMFRPDGDGLVTISPGSAVAGGHEFLCVQNIMEQQLLGFWNSWGTAWGPCSGMFYMSYDTFDRLLSEQGDVTFPYVR